MGRIDYHYDFLHNDENAKFYTNLIIAFNLIYAILGTLMLAVGFFITLEQDFRQYVQDLEMTVYMAGVSMLILAGTVVIVQTFFGICGAYMKKNSMLRIFFVLLLISFIFEVAGSIFLLVNGVKSSKLDIFLEDKFYFFISRYSYDVGARRKMDKIQEWIGCCGAYGVKDYINWKIPVPTTCYDAMTGNSWYVQGMGYMGCVQAFSLYVEQRSAWICGIALILAFFQLLGMLFSCNLINIKKDFRKRSLHDLRSK